MKIKVIITKEELTLLKITKEELSDIIIAQINDTDVNNIRMNYQAKVEVETVIENEYVRYNYPSLMVSK